MRVGEEGQEAGRKPKEGGGADDAFDWEGGAEHGPL